MNGRSGDPRRSETLGQFASRMLIAMKEVDDQVRREAPGWVSNFYSFQRLACQMEHKQKYGPWFRVWAQKISRLAQRSFEDNAFYFLKAPYTRGRWYIATEEGAPWSITGGTWGFIQVWPNERYKLPRIRKSLKLDGRAIMADVRAKGWA